MSKISGAEILRKVLRMSEKIVEYIHDKFDYPLFRVTYENDGKTATFHAVVDAVTGWDEKTKAATEHEPYIKSALIKWDSCSHFQLKDDNLHLCGVKDFKDHLSLLKWLYDKAFERMGREPLSDEKW